MRTNSTRATNIGMTSSSSRFMINDVDDDDELMQRVGKAEGLDSPEDFERMQNYGFTSTLLDQDEGDDKQQQQKQKSGGGNGIAEPEDMDADKKKGKGAEGMVMYPNGDRSHPVLIAADDRRYRPYSIPKGGSAQYDQHGQMTYLKAGGENQGVFMIACDTEEEEKKSSGGGGGPSAGTLDATRDWLTVSPLVTAPGGGGQKKKVARMASLRHVEKQKQSRDLKKKDKSKQAGQQQQQQKKKEYKHEGEDDKVNTEVRCTAGRIEFRAGGAVVGYYDKGSSTWYFTGKIAQMVFTDKIEHDAPKISETVTNRFETIGKTYLGLDGKGEMGPKVVTEDGPAKQTYSKVGA